MINVVNFSVAGTDVFALQFEESRLLLPTLYDSRQVAERALYDYAVKCVAGINARRNRVNEDGSKVRPGKQSDAEKVEYSFMVDTVARFEDSVREQEAIARFKATLSPEQLAVLEGVAPVQEEEEDDSSPQRGPNGRFLPRA